MPFHRPAWLRWPEVPPWRRGAEEGRAGAGEAEEPAEGAGEGEGAGAADGRGVAWR